MNTIITSKHFELTDSIKEYIYKLSDSLGKYNLDLISNRVVISYKDKKGKEKKKKIFEVDIAINIAKSNTIVVSQKDKDLYSACDLAFSRTHKILRRHHDRINNKHAIPSKEIISADILRDEVQSLKEDEIVPMDLDLHKPLDIDEALERLKSSSQQFFVFNDKDLKMRVIYKRIDGKYGLY